MVSTNVSILLQVLFGIFSVIMPILSTLITRAALRFFHISASSALAAHVSQGVDVLSDLALHEMHVAAANNASITSSAAVARVIAGASDALMAAAKENGITPEQLGQRVASALIPKIVVAPPAIKAAPVPLVSGA